MGEYLGNPPHKRLQGVMQGCHMEAWGRKARIGLSDKWPFSISLFIQCIFLAFLCICTHVLLQMSNHQNLWNLLVIIPNTKFGVYMSGFYARFGG